MNNMNNPNKFGYYLEGYAGHIRERQYFEAKTLKAVEKKYLEYIQRWNIKEIELVIYEIGFNVNKYDYKAYRVISRVGNAKAWFEYCGHTEETKRAKHETNLFNCYEDNTLRLREFGR